MDIEISTAASNGGDPANSPLRHTLQAQAREDRRSICTDRAHKDQGLYAEKKTKNGSMDHEEQQRGSNPEAHHPTKHSTLRKLNAAKSWSQTQTAAAATTGLGQNKHQCPKRAM